MLSLPEALMKREREVCPGPQVTHDIRLGTCSSNGDGMQVVPLWTQGVTAAVDGEGQSLEELDIICREESKVAVATSPPPALIHHLDVSNDVIRIKGKLITSLSLVVIQGNS